MDSLHGTETKIHIYSTKHLKQILHIVTLSFI